MDATMEALRFVSSEGCTVDRVFGDDLSVAALAGGESPQQQHRRGPTARLPSKEVLLTLLWALKVEERRLQIRNQVKTSKLGIPSVPQTTTPAVNKATYVLKVLPKRSLEAEHPVSLGCPSQKRRRVQ